MSADQQQQQEQRRRGSDVFLGSFREQDDDEQSIIDVFEFDDTSQDRWLCSLGNRSRKNSLETCKIEDLDAWLHAEISELDAAPADYNSRRSIDTRTFTRIKRRSNRLNSDGIEASISPETSPFFLSNIWKKNTIPESNEKVFNNNDEEQIMKNDKRDSIPMMLRPKTNQVLSALLSESPSSINSQTSMEAFMSVARKKGSNFLLSDASDPDFSSVLMNISQPSLLCTSITSDGRANDAVRQQSTKNKMDNSMTDSQILTDSMMEASMFKEVQDTTVLAEFLKESNDVTHHTKDINSYFNDKTFTNDDLDDITCTKTSNKESDSCNATFVAAKENFNSNDTYIADQSPQDRVNSANSTTIISPLMNKTLIVIPTTTSLNSTHVLSNGPELCENCILSPTLKLCSEHKTDLKFEEKSPSPIKRMDATFQASDSQSSELSGSTESNSKDSIFYKIPPLRAQLLKVAQRNSEDKLNTTFTNSSTKLDVTYDQQGSAEPLLEVESLDATFVYVPSKHKTESQINKPSLDATYDAMTLASKLSTPTNTTSTQHTSYVPNRKSEESQSYLLDPNRFNTFKKDKKIGSRLSKALQKQEPSDMSSLPPSQSHVPNNKAVDNSYQQRYKTFSKRTSLVKEPISLTRPAFEKKAEEKQQFVKPSIQQIQPPRRLSKLPQSFQKSHPNLGSNLRPPSNSGNRLSMYAGVGFYKGSQQNISNNMQALGRFKSERLLLRKASTDFSTSDGTSQSMESIDSNGSAHSAPDLDGRHSVASDSSRASYVIKPKNPDTLKKLRSLEDKMETFNGSTPKVRGHQVLENNWVQEKDLPSPILKNGVSKNHPECDSRSSSLSDSTEFSAKTSSPLTNSPSNSDNTINIIKDGGIGTIKENIQSAENLKPKPQIKAPSTTTTKGTMLRRPSNWTGASNKASNGPVSGIPRPASRIPAPRFVRPNPK
ncbi:uncharacterized protein LOC106641258 [Copidosoma floridanum]|uniref:uncharacterized protein LOC106641258 n=1 Tax=Copidosoma floridanum TaxID=29053 RepID=UPI0006C9A3F2|nr:uncharacterized protein LOC106641258 [Copidosoma floridanum]